MVKNGWKFDLCGGLLCLDFANTVSERTSDEPIDWIPGYGELVAFAAQTQAVSETEARRLRRLADERPEDAERAARRARVLRDVFYRLFSDLAGGMNVHSADLAAVNDAFGRTAHLLKIRPDENGFAWDWTPSDDMGWILGPIVRSATDLLASDERHRVRLCDSPTCRWLFLDTTKNHSRRWCTMTTCGNREKVRNFYRRNKGNAGRKPAV